MVRGRHSDSTSDFIRLGIRYLWKFGRAVIGVGFGVALGSDRPI
jgi:hypothetical protein